ncbi:MAG: RHS repeat-associated core domain-containing protein [Bdellovibrionaceae bacterium]|nr:RHS repeat-associated core domain-containing protein [Pseudobdellovibrionaceae bacterium]
MFVYEGDLRIIADINPSTGNIETRYVYVSQSHSPDYMMRGGQEYQFVKDHLGSVKLVVRVSDGVVMQNITYDEFGRVLSDTNPGFQPFGFAGGVYDAQTGLTKFGVRDYDAEVGRWLTKDPILFHGGDANLYGYVMMDPINLVDPDGEFGVALAVSVGVLYGLYRAFDAYQYHTNPRYKLEKDIKNKDNEYDPDRNKCVPGYKEPGKSNRHYKYMVARNY